MVFDEDEDKDKIIPRVCQINIWDSPTYKSKCNTHNLIEVVDLNGNPKWVCQEHIDNYKKMEKYHGEWVQEFMGFVLKT